MNTSREKFIKYFILDKIIRENKRRFKEEINSDNYYKYYKDNKICDEEVHKCFISKYQEAEKLVSSDKKKYIEIVDDIIKLIDVGGYDPKSDNYKKYYDYLKKRIILLLETDKDNSLNEGVDKPKNNILDIYKGTGGYDDDKDDKDKEEIKEKNKNNIINFIEELSEINSELENKEKIIKNYDYISDNIDKKFKEFRKYNTKYLEQINNKPIYIYNNQIFTDIKDNIIDNYLNFLELYSENELDKSYIESVDKLNNELLKVNLYFEKNNIKSNIYNKYKKINTISNEVIKKFKSIKSDNNNENELIRYAGNIIDKINQINNFFDLLNRENQQYNGLMQITNSSRPIIDNIKNIENNIKEIIENADNIYETINEIKDLIKKSILLKNVSGNVKEYIEELNKILKNMDKNNETVKISDANIEKNTIYNKIWETYIKNVSDSEKVLEDTQNKLYRQYEYNNLDPTKALALTLNDKVVFIVVCFCIRQIVLSIMGYMYDRNMINSFYLAIIYYVCFYVAIILIIVIVVNLDDYNLRIILNFFNINANISGIIMHVIIMILLALSIYHLVYLIAPSIHKNYAKNEIIDDVSKYKIIYDIELTTISMFFLTSIIVLVL